MHGSRLAGVLCLAARPDCRSWQPPRRPFVSTESSLPSRTSTPAYAARCDASTTAAHLGGFATVQIELTRGYGCAEFREDLKRACRQVGVGRSAGGVEDAACVGESGSHTAGFPVILGIE